MATSKSAAKRTSSAGSSGRGDDGALRTSSLKARERRSVVATERVATQGAQHITTAKAPRASRLLPPKKLGLLVKEAIGLHRLRPGSPVYLCVTVNERGKVSVQKITRKRWGGEKTNNPPDALEEARERGRTLAAEILSQDDMLSAEEFGHLVGTTRETINTRRRKNLVLGLAGAKRGYRFPTWQLNQYGKPFEALPALFERLGGGPWAVYRFLVQPHPELGGLTGQEALQEGKTDKVLEAAESIARGAFS